MLPSPDQMKVLVAGLAFGNDLRGGDSWGYATHNQDRVRGLGNLSMSGRINDIASLKQVLIHTRNASVGSVTIDNAHPFTFGHITGAHNGGISNHKELKEKYPDRANFEVDSMQVIKQIADDLPMDELCGSGTVEFIDDRRKNSIFIGKLSYDGDLSIACVRNEQEEQIGVVWSSNKITLLASLSMAGLEEHAPLYKDIEAGVLYMAMPNQLVKTETKIKTGFRSYTNNNYRKADGWEGVNKDDWEKSIYCRGSGCFMRIPNNGQFCSKHTPELPKPDGTTTLMDEVIKDQNARDAGISEHQIRQDRISRRAARKARKLALQFGSESKLDIDMSEWPSNRMPTFLEVAAMDDNQIITLVNKMDEDLLDIMDQGVKGFMINKYCTSLENTTD